MAGKYPTRKPARRITIDPDLYLTCRQGRWEKHQRVRVGNDPRADYADTAWVTLPIGPQAARRLMDAAEIKGGET